MALAAQTIWEVETGGDDTNNGGGFDPSRTAGMFTDGAATSATGDSPVFTSASYNFVAGDVGAWLFIGAGTNWVTGWYQIASVASNAATLSAAIGEGVSYTATGYSVARIAPRETAGCATTGSPTGATWSIDYSQQAAAEITYTDLASAGTGLTVSSVAKPFGRQLVGNVIVITGGTNFNTGRYVISSVAAITFVATVLGAGNITTGAGVNGTGGLGGAYATPGASGSAAVSTNRFFIQSGAYTITSATVNISGGCFSSTGVLYIEGYGTVRGDLGTKPVLTASGISTFTIISITGIRSAVINVEVDGATLTSSRGILTRGFLINCTARRCTNSGLAASTGTLFQNCLCADCTTVIAYLVTAATTLIDCVADTCTPTPFNTPGDAITFVRCIAMFGPGGSTHGFSNSADTNIAFINCIAYANDGDGFVGTDTAYFENCIAEINGGVGFNFSGASSDITVLRHCAAFQNSGGDFNFAGTSPTYTINEAFITGSTSFFTDGDNGDFSLNNDAGGGALLRGTGFPGVLNFGGTGYGDIGALQHQDSGSSGGGIRLAGRGGLAAGA